VRRTIEPKEGRAVPAFSQAVLAGNTLYISGQIAVNDNGDLVGRKYGHAQAEQCFANLDSVLRAAGMSMSDVVKLTCFLVDVNDYPAYAEVKRRYLSADKPAGTAVIVSALLVPDALFEVEAVAVKDDT
jgi:reactive intermediate/imine deaminase